MQYWYNLRTGRVEDDTNRARSAELLGPYDTEREAWQALEKARERTEAWDQADEEWEDADRD